MSTLTSEVSIPDWLWSELDLDQGDTWLDW
jgi:hypothetical protein